MWLNVACSKIVNGGISTTRFVSKNISSSDEKRRDTIYKIGFETETLNKQNRPKR